MTDDTTIVFLGINDAGRRVYDWLCNRDGIFVQALLTTEEQLSIVTELGPDYLISCGFRHIVPKDILEVPQEGCLNLHPALLPYNRGANPNVWSIIEGTPAGVTLHYMDEELDTGDIVAQREIGVKFSDSGKDLYGRLEDAQYDLFVDIWPAIESKEVTVTSQRKNDGTYHTTNEFNELCELDLDATYTGKQLIDRLRALTFPPYDNAYVEYDGKRYYVDIVIEEGE